MVVDDRLPVDHDDELAFALEYLGLDVSESRKERLMLRYDYDGSGALEYPEFRSLWFEVCNVRKELRTRDIRFSRWSPRCALRRSVRGAFMLHVIASPHRYQGQAAALDVWSDAQAIDGDGAL